MGTIEGYRKHVLVSRFEWFLPVDIDLRSGHTGCARGLSRTLADFYRGQAHAHEAGLRYKDSSSLHQKEVVNLFSSAVITHAVIVMQRAEDSHEGLQLEDRVEGS